MNSVLEVKNMKANLLTTDFYVGSRTVFLTPVEWKIMVFFMSNPNRLLSYEEIYRAVWGFGDIDRAIINTNINRIRKKIGKEKIDTIRGQGYILRATF